MNGGNRTRGMRTVLLASLRRNTRRYVASAVAVVIGVAFVIITNAVSSATREGLTADVGKPYEAVDLVLSPETQKDVDRLLQVADEGGFGASVVGYAMEPVFDDGVQLSESAYISLAATDPTMQWLEVREGRQPVGPGEALADLNSAKSSGVVVGDVLRVGSRQDAPTVEVVGLVDSTGVRSDDYYLPWEDLRLLQDSLWVQHIAWGGTAAQATQVAPTTTITDVDEHVAGLQTDIARGVDYLAYVALLFVAIALFVAVMVIANTFSILFAQRMRDFALLRCVGVTRRQLRRSVRLEALALGLVASVLGVLLGVVGGFGVVRVVGIRWDDIGAASFDPVWIGAAVAVGTLVTLGAAWLPTRAVTRVTPLAALRPDTGVDVRSAAGRFRIGAGLLLGVVGAGLLAYVVASPSLPLMLVGGTVAFLGVLLLGPVLVPAAIRLAGRLIGDGPVRRLATGNAVRNPRRTATTAASLLVGVTLTTAVLTGLASARTALSVEMDDSYPLDATITAVESPFGAEMLERAERVEGITEALLLDGTLAQVEGGPMLPLLGVEEQGAVIRGPRDLAPADGVVLLPYDVVNDLKGAAARQLRRAGTITVLLGDRSRTLQVEQGSGWGRAGLVSTNTLAALDVAPEPMALWATIADGSDAEDVNGDLAVLSAGSAAGLYGGYANRDWVDQQVDVLTAGVVGLLGIAVVIALIGIANTLGLSVLERARENALLRAMGLTRAQLRRAMATEGLLLALVATLLGMGLGVAFAWVGVQVLVAEVVTGAAMTLPVGQLAAVVVVAAVAGLAACVVPARRAGQVAPAAGLALE